MDAVRFEIWKNNELVSSQPGLVSYCEAVHSYLDEPGTPGDKHEFKVIRGNDVVASETVETR